MTQQAAQSIHDDDGITILEVVAMLVILSIAMLPLLDLTSQVQRNALAIENRIERSENMQNALSYLRSINVGVQREGRIDFGPAILSWEAELVAEDTEFTQTFRLHARQIGLYNVKFTIESEDDPRASAQVHQIRLVGWTNFVQVLPDGF